MPAQLAWAIFFAPIASFLICGLIIRPFFNRCSRWAGYVTIAAVGISFVLSVWTLFTVNATGPLPLPPIDWWNVGPIHIEIGLVVDPLTAIMLVVVSLVALLVQVYSQGYMHGDPGYVRYYAWMSLFTASMLGLVLAGNLLMMYVFWELVGLCSYLLIGVWFHRPSAANAAKKAFLVTR
ncbi:MAG: proton-conducting transporter membrane subunit, partial [Dehalococcoidia bacterium]|nr:proton-conducting transporter membrane subunit [Dehalococcoidia bacterium]